MDTIASFFHVYAVISHEVITKLSVQTATSIVSTIYGATRAWLVEKLIIHGITDKAPYLSKAIT